MPLNRLVDSGQQIVPPPDVQRTTLGVDALSRFVCNTWDEATANGTRHFDAVVIGAGMFGGYCAEKIYRLGQAQGLKVMVLDAGPFLVPTHVQNLPRIGLNVPGPLFPANDPGVPREVVWVWPGGGTSRSSVKRIALAGNHRIGGAGARVCWPAICRPGRLRSQRI